MQSITTSINAGFVALPLLLLLACGGSVGADSGDSRQQAAAAVDTQPPSIYVTVTVEADAVVLAAQVDDNVGVTQVDFSIDDGALRATNMDPKMPRSFVSRIPIAHFKPGDHQVIARARDAAGNRGLAPAVRFEVGRG